MNAAQIVAQMLEDGGGPALAPMNQQKRRGLSQQLQHGPSTDAPGHERAKGAAQDYLRKHDPNHQVKQGMKASERMRTDYLNRLRQQHPAVGSTLASSSKV